jgi:hypothetical protein
LQETNRILSEKQAETDRMLKETSASQAETALQMKETALQMKETDRQISRLEKNIGGISTNNGLFAEEYFYNSLERGEKILMGEKFDKLIKSKILVDENNKTTGELDIILINGKSLVIVEVKFRVREKHVEKVMKKVKPFRERFPEYQNHKVYLGLASMVFDEDIEEKCKENGIAVIKQVGDSVVVHDENLKAF